VVVYERQGTKAGKALRADAAQLLSARRAAYDASGLAGDGSPVDPNWLLEAARQLQRQRK
jgi:hypothetical protein